MPVEILKKTIPEVSLAITPLYQILPENTVRTINLSACKGNKLLENEMWEKDIKRIRTGLERALKQPSLLQKLPFVQTPGNWKDLNPQQKSELGNILKDLQLESYDLTHEVVNVGIEFTPEGETFFDIFNTYSMRLNVWDVLIGLRLMEGLKKYKSQIEQVFTYTRNQITHLMPTFTPHNPTQLEITINPHIAGSYFTDEDPNKHIITIGISSPLNPHFIRAAFYFGAEILEQNLSTGVLYYIAFHEQLHQGHNERTRYRSLFTDNTDPHSLVTFLEAVAEGGAYWLLKESNSTDTSGHYLPALEIFERKQSLYNSIVNDNDPLALLAKGVVASEKFMVNYLLNVLNKLPKETNITQLYDQLVKYQQLETLPIDIPRQVEKGKKYIEALTIILPKLLELFTWNELFNGPTPILLRINLHELLTLSDPKDIISAISNKLTYKVE